MLLSYDTLTKKPFNILVIAVMVSTTDNCAASISMQNLKKKLYEAHTVIVSFIREKIKIQHLEHEATPRDIHRAARKLIARMLNGMPEAYAKQIVHLIYLAIQEREHLEPKAFREQYEINLHELREPDQESLKRLAALLPKTPLWYERDALLKECEKIFKLM